jgi:phosphoglycerate kinase
MPKQTVRDLDVNGQKVLVRVDFNVPQTEKGDVADDRRIRAALPTLTDILERGGSLILVSHLGRPTGDPVADAPFRMDHVAKRLETLIGRPVKKSNDTVGPDARTAYHALVSGGIVVLENVRFNKGEKKGDVGFAKEMATLADAYVNDAFGTCHREEASMVAVPEHFPPEKRAIGFLVEKELRILDTLLSRPESPYLAVMGGAKVSDKILVIEQLLRRVDALLVGGAMTYTFLKAQGHGVGQSKVEADKLDVARHVLTLAGSKLVLPVDHLVASRPEAGADVKVVDGPEIPDGWFGMDIGPKTIDLYSKRIKDARTVVWNGPMGKFEIEAFARGTRAVAQAMADSSAVTAVGGGESAEAVEKFGLADEVTHVSTGGGAFLESLEGKSFRSLEVIPDR